MKSNDNPIFGIIERGDLQQVKELLGKTYALSTLNDAKADPIIFASQKGQLEIVKFLIDKNNEANLDCCDYDGISALQWASYNGHLEVVKLLIEHGADVNTKCNDGITPLMEAAQWGHTEIIKLLIDNGADVNAKDNSYRTALDYAKCEGCAVANRNKTIEILEESKEKVRRLR